MTTLKDIRERWEKATPGPWKAIGGSEDICISQALPNEQYILCYKCLPNCAEAIANAPTDIAYLLGLVERAKHILCNLDSWHPFRDEISRLLKDMESAKGGE